MSEKTVQELQFELMKRASFNGFSGEQVVKDLKKNKGLWKGAFMFMLPAYEPINLIPLRDIEDNEWNVDTLFINTNKKNLTELLRIVSTWNADEVEVEKGKKACDFLGSWSKEMEENTRIIKVWWD